MPTSFAPALSTIRADATKVRPVTGKSWTIDAFSISAREFRPNQKRRVNAFGMTGCGLRKDGTRHRR